MVMEFYLSEQAYGRVKELNSGKRPYVFFKEQNTGTFFLHMHGTKEGLLGVGNTGYEPKLFIERAFESIKGLHTAVINSKRPLGIIACHCGLMGAFDVNGVRVVPISDTHDEIQAYVGETIDDEYVLEIFTKDKVAEKPQVPAMVCGNSTDLSDY